jgi:hypothetical protein
MPLMEDERGFRGDVHQSRVLGASAGRGKAIRPRSPVKARPRRTSRHDRIAARRESHARPLLRHTRSP